MFMIHQKARQAVTPIRYGKVEQPEYRVAGKAGKKFAAAGAVAADKKQEKKKSRKRI
jgi:hypothetical protein